MKHIIVTIGTRPEAIKMAPVLKALQHYPEDFRVTLVSTAQHRQMLDQVLEAFQLEPEVDLDTMRPNQSLSESSARALRGLDKILADLCPDLLLVQGDTNTVLAGAMAAYFHRIPVGHVEAGLRTNDPYRPFPEEMNRRLTSPLTRLHFAPTVRARDNLLREGIPGDRIFVTGNTVVDALLWIARERANDLPQEAKAALDRGQRLVLVTSHRRESLDQDLHQICLALRDLIRSFEDIEILYPVHLNPRVQETVREILGSTERIHLIAPLPYPTFVQLLRVAYLILTDSGGVQEEAPTFGTPVLVLREVTERSEAIDAGVAELIGVKREDILQEASHLLKDHKAYARFARPSNPFGDGYAAERIVRHIKDFFESEKE
jgi:UDP-N-acetylglucosamine 2-epimerase (non-hydrolysing)